MILYRFILLNSSVLLMILGISCTEPTRFEKLDAGYTGISFQNRVEPSPDLNIFNYLYFYNGGGVGAGDLNGDGLVDLVFVSNQGENKLYLNEGQFKFQDITERIQQETRQNKWSTGVSLADVNGDGLLDIYLSEVGSYLRIEGHNKLYINQGNDEHGIPMFSEEAAKYGLDLVGFSTQAAFFDYDLDNDLDLYMLNHSVHSNGTFGGAHIRTESHPLAGDRFFRNDNGRFVDVTQEAGIYNSPLGYGLGVGISDINQDGYPDIYVGNDFHEDDYLYINNGDGTFTESLGAMINHTSRYSMGNDLADINNDGLIDILTLDMLPRDYEKIKTSPVEDDYEVYQFKLKHGYKDQFARNTLQLNRGNGKFSEIGLLADVAATDWSWSGFFADLDLDGLNDLFIANGIVGRTNDLDYIKFISNEAIQLRLEGSLTEQDLMLTEKMPVVKVPNFAFRNAGNLRFEDVSEAWGLNHESFSNGAVYADLDNDGDLDIIINNINSEAFVYRNTTRERNLNSKYLKVRLNGPRGNTRGLGAKLIVELPGGKQIVRELFPVRGYESSGPHEIHIGVDSSHSTLTNVRIIWPDGRSHELTQVELNQTLLIDYADSKVPVQQASLKTHQTFKKLNDQLGFTHEHRENDFLEFNREALMPGMISALGPAFAKADINDDGLDDFFVGGAKHQASFLFYQKPDGHFVKDSLRDDPKYEDVDAIFLDVDEDGDLDLLVASGGNEFWGQSEFLNPRVYINTGGAFNRDTSYLSDVYINASTIASADFDGDGDTDIFIGERALPWKYGLDPQSILIINDRGTLVVDQKRLPVTKLGMVTGAQWADMNSDGKLDLVVCSEWSTVKILYQEANSFRPEELAGSEGLWNTLTVADMDNNGYPDIIGGNLGLNSKLSVAGTGQINMYVNDFDDNGAVEQIITLLKDGREQFFANRDELKTQLNFISKKYTDYKSFAQADLSDVIPEEKLRNAKKYQVSDTRSAVFYQAPDGTYERKALAVEGQIAPVFEIFVYDFNFDKLNDLMLGGNFSRTNIQRGKYDASLGEIFLQWNDLSLKYIAPQAHGLYLSGEIRHIEMLKTNGIPVMLVAKNNGPIEIYAFDYH